MDVKRFFRWVIQRRFQKEGQRSFSRQIFVRTHAFMGGVRGIWIFLCFAAPYALSATELIVMRHGQTEWNKEHLLQGHTDIPLDPTGIDQVREAAQLLKGVHFDAVYASPLSRTQQTAQIMAEMITAPSPLLDERLMGPSFGASEGRKEDPQMQKEMREEHFDHIPGGEDPLQFKYRVNAFLKEVATQYPANKRVLIVTHSGVIRLLLREATGLSNRDTVISNAALYRFYLAPDGTLTYLERVTIKNREALTKSLSSK